MIAIITINNNKQLLIIILNFSLSENMELKMITKGMIIKKTVKIV